MNAQLQESTAIAVIPPKPLSVIERAANALSQAETEEQIKALVEESKPIVAVTDPASREVCHASLMTLKNMRILIQNRAKDGRDEAVKYSKAVIAIEKELVALITPEETRLAAIRDEWDTAKEREKEAKIAAEIARVAALQERIAELRGCQTLSPSSGSQLVLEHIADLESIPVDSTFEELEQQASDAKTAALVRLNGILGAAVAHEAEQAKIIAERAELARLRAAEEDRQEKARTEQAERDRLAKIETDRLAKEAHDKKVAEAREHAETIRKDRERIAKEEADAKAKVDAERAENDRKAAERQAELDAQAETQRVANAAEAKRLADQQAEINRQQAALVEAQKPKPAPITVQVNGDPAAKVNARIVERPSAAQLVALVGGHYGVSLEMAAKWILTAKIELEATA